MRKRHVLGASLTLCLLAGSVSAQLVECNAKGASRLGDSGRLSRDWQWSPSGDWLKIDLSQDTMQRAGWKDPLRASITWMGPDVMRVETTFYSAILSYSDNGIAYYMQDARRIVHGSCSTG